MAFIKSILPPPVAISCALFPWLLLTGCDGDVAKPVEEEDTSFFTTPPVVVPEIHRNSLSREPSDFLRSRVGDPIHWQPWSPAVLEHAQAEQKLIFVMVGSGRFPECVALLDALRAKPAMIENLRDNYVCCLVDVDVQPEMAIQMALLANEVKRRISFPAIMWCSHEGNPVAWLPLTPDDVADIDEVFGNSDAMVSRIWRDSSKYVIQNSRRDNEGRRLRLAPVLAEAGEIGTLREVSHDALRRISSLYDPGSGNIDGGGGLVPSSLWRLAGTAALAPQTDPNVAARLTDLLTGNTDLLLRSAVRDPLDGGFFSARRSSGWEIPVFMKTAETQVQMALALARISVLLKSPRHLEAAAEILQFAGTRFGAEGSGLGAYDASPPESLEALAFLWSQEALREFLTAEEFAVASAAYGISGVGNIPPESDPKREFFRKNSLGAKLNAAEVAERLGLELPQVEALLEAVRKRLLAQREEVLGRGNAGFRENARVTATNARYAAALAELSFLMDAPEMLKRAREVLAYLESRHRSADGDLLRLPRTENRRSIPARGEDFAALLDAHLALYRADLDPGHLVAARKLTHTLLTEHVSADGLIVEQSAEDRIGNLDIFNNWMVFGDSTWGIAFGALTRIRQLTGDAEIARAADTILRSKLHQLAGRSPSGALIQTDFLVNAQIAVANTLVYLEGTPGSPEFDALHRVLRQPKYWSVTVLHLGEGLPDGIQGPSPSGTVAAHVKRGADAPRSASDPAGLEQLLQEALEAD